MMVNRLLLADNVITNVINDSETLASAIALNGYDARQNRLFVINFRRDSSRFCFCDVTIRSIILLALDPNE